MGKSGHICQNTNYMVANVHLPPSLPLMEGHADFSDPLTSVPRSGITQAFRVQSYLVAGLAHVACVGSALLQTCHKT